MELKVYKIDGTESGDIVKLPDEVFAIEPNNHLIYQAVRSFLAGKRQGTHKSKERNEVHGGGTGSARRGTSRSPIMVGGGTIFGPKPHKYSVNLPLKAARLARKSALSLKAKENEITVVEDFSFEKPKTKDLLTILQSLNLNDVKTLFLLTEKNEGLYKSGRNLKNLNVKISDKAATYDIVNNKMILIQKSAIANLCKSLI
ncbi:MAG: 50S ribosomal protein L4 [Ignavibacteriae bacterium]|nr:50S ribosomal protein L4 [Ignavibacteriota bacterium]